MGVLLSNTARSAACDAIVDLMDTYGQGTITIKDDADVSLAILTCSSAAFGSASNGVATANTITEEDSALASGTPDYAVFANASATTIWSCDCAVGSGSINFPSTITSGVEVQITSLTFTVPSGSL